MFFMILVNTGIALFKMKNETDFQITFLKNARNEPHIMATLINLQYLVEQVCFINFVIQHIMI
jgi:hypothetical protein